MGGAAGVTATSEGNSGGTNSNIKRNYDTVDFKTDMKFTRDDINEVPFATPPAYDFREEKGCVV